MLMTNMLCMAGQSKRVHKTSAVSRVLLTGSTLNLIERRSTDREQPRDSAQAEHDGLRDSNAELVEDGVGLHTSSSRPQEASSSSSRRPLAHISADISSPKHVTVNVMAAPLMEKTGIQGAIEAVNSASMYGAGEEELIKVFRD